MVFSSLTFLLYFWPAAMGLYFGVPKAWRNACLLAASLLFYGWANPSYIPLVSLEILAGWLAGLWMEKNSKIPSKWILAACIVLFAGIFCFFKYTDFLIENLNGLFSMSLKPLNVLLPLGISFYTFQILSYVIDVYRQQVSVQKSLVDFACYVLMFPQLVAGPIVRYDQIADSLWERSLSWKQTGQGMGRFVCGLAKKVLIANVLYTLCQDFRLMPDQSVLSYWIFALAVFLYTYYDFSGYSDMAIGLGKMMGFSFPENFAYPITALSVTDFWRRWHMSLTSWFKDYVYIPLGGSRGPVWKTIRNLLAVWLFTGLWHGASWSFIAWGLAFFVLIVLEKFVLNPSRPLGWASRVYVLFFVLVLFVLFHDDSLEQFALDLQGLTGWANAGLCNGWALYTLRSQGLLLAAALLGATPLVHKGYQALKQRCWFAWMMPLMQAAALLLCIAQITGGSYNPFLYFRF